MLALSPANAHVMSPMFALSSGHPKPRRANCLPRAIQSLQQRMQEQSLRSSCTGRGPQRSGLYDRRELILHFARFSLIKQEALSQPFKSREYRVGTVMVAFLIQVFPRKFANGVWPLSDMEPITLSI